MQPVEAANSMKDQAPSEKRIPTVPVHFRAADAVGREQHFEGVLPVALLPRLHEALSGPAEALAVQLQFAAHPRSSGRVRGRIQGALPLTCQRSLAVFAWPLDITFDWILVRDEQEEERLLQEADPVLLDDGELRLREAIEDEVLLALPLIPLAPDAVVPKAPLAKTPDAQSGKKRSGTSAGKTKAPKISDNVELDDSRPNPFAALKGQFTKN
jgi:uncharacterized protein